MNKKIIFVCSIIVAFFIGISSTLLVLHYFPLGVFREKVLTGEKEVTISDNGISESVSKIYDSVVVIVSYANNVEYSSGTGFIYKKEGNDAYIITNNHVVNGSDTFEVLFNDGTKVEGKLMAGDVFADIAVMKINTDKDISIATIGKSVGMRLGDTVFTVGAPYGSEYSGTVTRGIISGLDRLVSISLSSTSKDWIMKVIQTDASINPGNSGGPLVNINGEVIGVNTLKLVTEEIEGIGFALPIEDVMTSVAILEKGESITRPYFGVGLLDVSDKYQLYRLNINIDKSVTKGAVLSEIAADSAASKADFKVGDVIIKVNDNEVDGKAEFRYELYKYKVGEEVKITFMRGKDVLEKNITLDKNN